MGSVNTVNDKLVLKIKLPKKIKVKDSFERVNVKRYKSKCESAVNDPCFFDPPCIIHRKKNKLARNKSNNKCWICHRPYINKVAFKKHLMMHMGRNNTEKGSEEIIRDKQIVDNIEKMDRIPSNSSTDSNIINNEITPSYIENETITENRPENVSVTENNNINLPEQVFKNEDITSDLAAKGNGYVLPNGFLTKEQLDLLVFFQNYVKNNSSTAVDINTESEAINKELIDLDEACKFLENI